MKNTVKKMNSEPQNIQIDASTALVLEGGGMRGVFTVGVLDNFMDRGLRFPYTIGVSAGASNGLSFMSRQRGRAKKANIDLLEQYHYIGLKYLVKQRNIMDFNLMFGDFPEHIIPYDYATYAATPDRFEMVTTNCVTGQPQYWEEKHNEERIISIAKASCSLPFVCPIAYVDGQPMLDGGITDSIPVERAFSQGYQKAVVVLTRNRGYRKKQHKFKIPPFIYKEYPNIREALVMRSIVYNKQLDLVERLEDEGRITVIRPQKPIEVDRIERDTRKLTTLYKEGYAVAQQLSINSNYPSPFG